MLIAKIYIPSDLQIKFAKVLVGNEVFLHVK